MQGWNARISASMCHSDGKDNGNIMIGPGPSSNGGSLSINISDMNKFVDALATDDTKITKYRMKIRQYFQLIEQEAERAIKSQERKNKIAANKREREHKAHQQARAELQASITDDERQNYLKLMDYSEDMIKLYYDTDEKIDIDIMDPYGNEQPKRNDEGHLIISKGGGWSYKTYDLTAGVKVYDSEESEHAAV